MNTSYKIFLMNKNLNYGLLSFKIQQAQNKKQTTK